MASDSELPIFVGCCGFGDPAPQAVMLLNMSLSTGKLSIVGEPVATPGGENPGWLHCSATSDIMYCAFEDAPGKIQGMKITGSGALGLDPVGDAVSTVGRAPAHIAMDTTGRWLFVANYVEGSVAVLPVNDDGSVGRATDSKMHQGWERVPPEFHDRQERPHCHQCLVHPSNKWVLVIDLGLSTVFVYGFNAENGALVGAADDPRHLKLDIGAGCRHGVWGKGGEILFVNNELDCTVTTCKFDAATGKLLALGTVPTLPSGVTPLRAGHRGNSDIHIHPNGRFLYVGCRSPDPGLIAVFAIDYNWSLTLVSHHSTGGLVPRNFKLVDDGKWLVVGNQESKTVVCFRTDPETGKLELASEVTTPLKPCNICPTK